ncbi:injection protein, partial [Staphylococcus aureus]|nr:injection protein [Staphylococcus aureus]
NLLVDLPSGRYALNKPGLSSEDIMPLIANAVAFTPAARAPTIVGATARSAGTDLALQSSVNMAGGGDINPWQTALSAGIG